MLLNLIKWDRSRFDSENAVAVAVVLVGTNDRANGAKRIVLKQYSACLILISVGKQIHNCRYISRNGTRLFTSWHLALKTSVSLGQKLIPIILFNQFTHIITSHV